ncbi:hypothetical protein BRADI_3g28115v3 [Brachypodium distachyon]|uniref:Uncharacterized protein n=1 Tax=Brachypodium distachyon TaxID=15368 RepID=A0A0Q3JF66_BRADI|nr:hypothetical protein BRADI_3g28115v3 [Brachypodium distachyon]
MLGEREKSQMKTGRNRSWKTKQTAKHQTCLPPPSKSYQVIIISLLSTLPPSASTILPASLIQHHRLRRRQQRPPPPPRRAAMGDLTRDRRSLQVVAHRPIGGID